MDGVPPDFNNGNNIQVIQLVDMIGNKEHQVISSVFLISPSIASFDVKKQYLELM